MNPAVDISKYLPPVHTNLKTSLVVIRPSTEYGQDDTLESATFPEQFGTVKPICLHSVKHFKFRRPNDLPWTHWPVTFPQSMSLASAEIDENGRLPSSGTVLHMMQSQSHFVLDLKWFHPDHHYSRGFESARAVVIRDTFFPGKPLLIRHAKTNEFVEVRDLDLGAAAAGTMHFNQNYSNNFRAIGNEILRKFYDNNALQYTQRHGWPIQRQNAHHANETWRKQGFSRLEFPHVLQHLFAFREASDDDHRHNFMVYFDLFSKEKFTWGSRLVSEQWIGSGKYPSRTNARQSLWHSMDCFWGLGLIEFDFVQKSMHLSKAGEGFLNAMHRTNDDPDCMFRFADSATNLIPASEIPRIDDWMLRFFRKMKQKST